MSCRVVINQSNYLPWKGYFDLIHDADVFIFLDDVQYTHRDWRSRNRIKTQTSSSWLTIPAGSAGNRLINEVKLPDGDWRARHWRLIEQSYRSSPHFSYAAGFFRELYSSSMPDYLSEFNQFAIKRIAREFLGISTSFLRSEDFPTSKTKQERLLHLLQSVGATSYISGPAAKTYINPDDFAAEGIELIWKDYSAYPEYQQPFPPFEHAVSIVDLLFCVGPRASDYIWGWRETT